MLSASSRSYPVGAHRQRRPAAWSRSSVVRPAAEPPGPPDPVEKRDGDADEQVSKKPIFSHALNENFAAEELMEELRDKQGFGNRGEVVFLAQLVLTFLVMFPPMQLRGLLFMCGALALIFGAIATTLSFVGLGKSFSPLVTPRKSNTIISNGMFQYMRHPLYAGLIWLGFGLSAVTYSETRFVLSCLLFLVLNYKAGKEEEAMLQKHGEEYKQYMMSLHRFVPTL